MSVGRGEHDLFNKMLGAPVVIDEVAAEPVEELGMGGEVALQAEVFRRADEAISEELLPDTIDVNAGRERVIGKSEPLG